MNDQKQIDKKGKTGKIILLSIGLIGLGVGGYFAYRYFSKEDEPETNFTPDQTDNDSFVVPKESKRPSRTGGGSSIASKFPLKRGSRGKYVSQLQSELVRRFGKTILGAGGVDGIFGRMTEKALVSNGLPSIITSRNFEDLTSGKKRPNKGDIKIIDKPNVITVSKPKDLAYNLRTNILSGRFDLAIQKLQKIKSVKDYELVNEFFKEWIVFGVRKTIVTALLHRFTSSEDKTKLSGHFYRIGLVKRDSKWHIPALGNIPNNQLKIKAIKQTKIWNIKGESLQVPSNTILGEFLHAGNGVTEFATLDDKVLFVNTKHISYT